MERKIGTVLQGSFISEKIHTRSHIKNNIPMASSPVIEELPEDYEEADETGGTPRDGVKNEKRDDDDDGGGYGEDRNDDANKRSEFNAVVRRIFSDKNVVDILSDLVAVLEHIKYENRPTGKKVFETDWCRRLFTNGLNEDMKRNFDIEKWYSFITSKGPSPLMDDSGGVMDPSLYNAQIKTDWVLPLLHLECMSPGFVTTLHGILSLEKKSQMKMNQYTNLTCNSSLYGLTGKNGVGGENYGDREEPANMGFGGFIGYKRH